MIISAASDYRAAAQRILPPFLFHYMDGGAYSEYTLRRNVEDLSEVALRQRILKNMSDLSLETTLFNEKLSMPVALAPVGLCGMYARRGEVQAAKAADAHGIPFTLSTVSVCPIEEVAPAIKRPMWFQLYVLRDRGFMRNALERAKAAGCSTLVFTVDMPTPGARYRDAHSGMSGPNAAMRRYLQAVTHPQWAWDVGLNGRPHDLGNISAYLGKPTGLEDYIGWLGNNFDPSISWKDLEWIRDFWDGPMVIKGILDPEDARDAVRFGADGIVVSNHGGRQLDGVLSSARALPAIADAVKGDIGVDMTLFKDLNFTIDYFRENRKNIFLQRQTISVETGITGTAPYGNLGRVKNEGLDMSFNYNHSFNKDFFISARGTFTLAKNEYVERDEPPYEYSYMSQVGQPLNNYYGYIAEGLFQSEDEIADSPTQELGTYKTQVGDIKYKDLNGDGKIDGTDKTYIGNPSVPQIIYGFGASMQYKGWDASFFFQGVAKRDIMLQGIHSFTGNTHNLMQWVVDNYWREDGANPSAEYPRLTNGSNPNTTEPSTYWLKDGSYIRLKNVELGYTWKFLRAYVAGANLLTFSKFKIWDPELNTQNGQAYPTQRTVSVGLQMTF